MLMLAGVVGAVVAIAVAFVLPEKYRVTGKFVPESTSPTAPQGLGNLAGLASSFGLTQGGELDSPMFYEELISTRTIVEPLATGTYQNKGAPVSMLDLLRVDEDLPETRKRELAVKRFRDRLSVSADAASSVVTFTVDMPVAEVAARVAERLMASVQAFNVDARQTRGQAERRFLEERVGFAQVALDSAEQVLRTFLEENRAFNESPALAMEHERLTYQVEFRRSLFTSLNQQLELARVEEVRNTPGITLVEGPYVPWKPVFPRKRWFAVLGLLFGGVVAAAMIWWKEASVVSSVARTNANVLEEAVRDLTHRYRRQSRRSAA